METGHFLKDPTGARQYLETLIRDHLAIMKDLKFEQPPSRAHYIIRMIASKTNIKAHRHQLLKEWKGGPWIRAGRMKFWAFYLQIGLP